jgi:hypothetical protein
MPCKQKKEPPVGWSVVQSEERNHQLSVVPCKQKNGISVKTVTLVRNVPTISYIKPISVIIKVTANVAEEDSRYSYVTGMAV